MAKQYDESNKESIVSYANRLKNKSLRSVVSNPEEIPSNARNKGEFGTILEKYYFEITPGSDKSPDFKKAGLELKSFPLKKIKKGEVVKERLVLGIINYETISDEKWDTSSFLEKNRELLLVGYLHDPKKSLLDYIIKIVETLKILDLPKEDLIIIKEDWEKIVNKIRNNHADELSEGDTMYLGACTKGSTSLKSFRNQAGRASKAKQRAFAFKPRFLNYHFEPHLEKAEKIIKNVSEFDEKNSFDEIVTKRFRDYIGMNVEQIEKKLGIHTNQKAKNSFSTLARAILGVKSKTIEEFEKAEIIFKTIRLDKNNLPEEHISFPYFKYTELVQEKWESSNLRNLLEHRFFFVIFKKDEYGDYRLCQVRFWTMPQRILEGEVKKVWSKTVKQVKAGNVDNLPGAKFSQTVHVRPHAKNAQDTTPAPNGQRYIKKCFWLDRSYIRDEVVLGK